MCAHIDPVFGRFFGCEEGQRWSGFSLSVFSNLSDLCAPRDMGQHGVVLQVSV
jgi:hypothetical protein